MLRWFSRLMNFRTDLMLKTILKVDTPLKSNRIFIKCNVR